MKQAVIKKELDTYLPLLSSSQQALILDMVKNILHVDTKEKRISIEQYNIEIEAALKEVKNGKGISHEEVVAKTKKWLKRK
ncbi:MAG: hypothetical protein M3R17_01430 [Bacteroidota bacterium]|nr:hypothetical protein [Bacteroidota bacterium]